MFFNTFIRFHDVIWIFRSTKSLFMRIGKRIGGINSTDSLPEDIKWRSMINSLAVSQSMALIEIDRNQIIYLSPLASDLLGIHETDGIIRLSQIFRDSSKLRGLKQLPALTLHTKENNKPIHLSLIKKLSGWKMLYEITKNITARPEHSTKQQGNTKSDAFMSLLLKSSPMTYYSYDPSDRKNIWYSEQIETLSGFKMADFRDNPGLWVSRIHPEDYSKLADIFDQFEPNKHISSEYRWMNAKNQVIWILDQAILLESSQSKTWQVVGCFMDITDRKEAEFAVLDSERNYREIFNSSNEAIFIHDTKTGKVQDVNTTMLTMYKTSYENALTHDLMHFSDGRPPYDDEHAKQYLDRAFTTGEIQQFTWLAHRNDQSSFWAEVTLRPVTISGETKIMASVKNIDQKKKAEQQIKYQTHFEKLILDLSTLFINIPYDKVDNEIETSIKKLCRFSNTDAGYLFLFDDDKNTMNLNYLWERKNMNFSRSQLQQMKNDTIGWYMNTMKAGQVIMIENLDDLPEEESNLKSIIAAQGVNSLIDVPLLYQNNVIGSLGIAVGKPGRKWLPYEVSLLRLMGQIFVNAIKRKESFLKLLENEEKYRHLIESQTDLIMKLSPEGRFLFVNPSYCEVFGFVEKDILGGKFSSTIPEDEQENMAKMMDSLFSPPYNCHCEQRVLTKNGWRWIAWNNKAILNEKNEVVEILGVGRDITYQRGVEDALRRSEDRFRSIVQHSSDAIFIVDRGSNIMYDTPTIYRVLGYEEGSLVGKKGADLIHPDDLGLVIEYIQNLLQDKQNLSPIEFRFKHYNGHWLPLEGFAINMLDHPSIQGIVVTLRDISERKQIEKKIFDAVIRTEEQERERFAKNLHDDLGPLLSSIKMYVNSLDPANNREKQDYIVTQLNEVVKEAIQTTKDVSNDLSPHILQNYGLVSAIENFLQKVPSSIKINFSNSLLSERYSNTIENSFYRILKELINNTLKHAVASQIDIGMEELGDNLCLHYADNGKGFEMKNNTIMSGSGMGLSNIISRARSLNGSYEFLTNPGEGFTFKISIPMHQLLE